MSGHSYVVGPVMLYECDIIIINDILCRIVLNAISSRCNRVVTRNKKSNVVGTDGNVPGASAQS